MLFGGDGLAIVLAGHHAPEYAFALVIATAVAISFAAERCLPYEPLWNRPLDDAARDTTHAAVNETLILASVAVIPSLAGINPLHRIWPNSLPLLVQVIVAVLVADFGITTVHLASHHVGWMWRLHAVHHSVRRCYGFNGLMKHPLHQALEMAGGVAPLIVLGLPVDIASALAACVAVQLLLQHSNVDYRIGPMRGVLALNEGHRFHHLKWAGVGDVNFGLFTLIWDRIYGTYSYDALRRFTSDDLGMAAKPRYPNRYFDQLIEPFHHTGACRLDHATEPSQIAPATEAKPSAVQGQTVRGPDGPRQGWPPSENLLRAVDPSTRQHASPDLRLAQSNHP